jgi:dihydrofolate reductase
MLNEVKSRIAGRKLKLQMQMTVDGFVAGPNGDLDWMEWNWSDDINNYVNDLHDTVNTILLGRKMMEGFITHWASVVDKRDESSIELKENYEFAKKMIDTPKVVFTKTLNNHNWTNTTIAKGELKEEVNGLKGKKGKDIIVYGGASFVSSLVKDNLIDEYYLFVNPSVIGNGLSIFTSLNKSVKLKLVDSLAFDCGIVLLNYKPV